MSLQTGRWALVAFLALGSGASPQGSWEPPHEDAGVIEPPTTKSGHDDSRYGAIEILRGTVVGNLRGNSVVVDSPIDAAMPADRSGTGLEPGAEPAPADAPDTGTVGVAAPAGGRATGSGLADGDATEDDLAADEVDAETDRARPRRARRGRPSQPGGTGTPSGTEPDTQFGVDTDPSRRPRPDSGRIDLTKRDPGQLDLSKLDLGQLDFANPDLQHLAELVPPVVLLDAAWPSLVSTIVSLRTAGFDVGGALRTAAARPVPAERPAAELMYRLLEAAEAGLSEDHGDPAGRPHRPGRGDSPRSSRTPRPTDGPDRPRGRDR